MAVRSDAPGGDNTSSGHLSATPSPASIEAWRENARKAYEDDK